MRCSENIVISVLLKRGMLPLGLRGFRMKVYALTMTEDQIQWIDQHNVYFKPDIVFDVKTMSFVENTKGALLVGKEFIKGLYAVELCKLGSALKPSCNTLENRIDLDCFDVEGV